MKCLLYLYDSYRVIPGKKNNLFSIPNNFLARSLIVAPDHCGEPRSKKLHPSIHQNNKHNTNTMFISICIH